MERINCGSVIRQRMLRLKRKNVLRRQRSLREKILFAEDEFENQLTDDLEPLYENGKPKGNIGKLCLPLLSSDAKIEIAKSNGEFNLIKGELDETSIRLLLN